jgi:hypothetical protein
MKKILIISALVLLVSCTDNRMAREFGGNETVELPKDRILINCTWKESHLWLLTKDTTNGKMYFSEKSSWGLLEGQIEFK